MEMAPLLRLGGAAFLICVLKSLCAFHRGMTNLRRKIARLDTTPRLTRTGYACSGTAGHTTLVAAQRTGHDVAARAYSGTVACTARGRRVGRAVGRRAEQASAGQQRVQNGIGADIGLVQ